MSDVLAMKAASLEERQVKAFESNGTETCATGMVKGRSQTRCMCFLDASFVRVQTETDFLRSKIVFPRETYTKSTVAKRNKRGHPSIFPGITISIT